MNLNVNSTKLYFEVVSDAASGLVATVKGNVTINNVSSELWMNQSTSSSNISAMVLGFARCTIYINQSLFVMISTAAAGVVVVKYSQNITLTMNFTTVSGSISGSNSENLGLLLGSTLGTTTVSMKYTYVCVQATYPNLSLGTISYVNSISNKASPQNITLTTPTLTGGFYIGFPSN